MSSSLTAERPLAVAVPLSRRAWQAGLPLVLGGIVLLATLVRVLGISTFALSGDEYGSLDEATTHLGANLTSLLYDVILRGFLTFGHSEAVLRLPAVILGIAAVPVLYLLASTLFDRRTGLVAALLIATSSFALGYSQEVRFYSLFLFSGCLSLYAAALVLRDGVTRRRLILLAFANALCLASQPLGVLLVGAEACSLILLSAAPGRFGRRLTALLSGVAVAALVVIIPHVRAWGYHALARYTNADAGYSGARGIHLANVVKIAWTFFVFTFGERVYPLWLWLTIPGTLLVLFLLARGLWSMRSNRLAIGILLPQLILGPLLLYLVLDALASKQLQGAGPRYLIPLLGPYLIVLAAGITSWRRRWVLTLSLFLALALNATSVGAYWQNAWGDGGVSPNWRHVASMVAYDSVPGAWVLVDGRSVDPSQYYLQTVERSRHLLQANLETRLPAAVFSAPRLIVISDTDRTPNQTKMNQNLDSLEQRYRVFDSFVQYPLFVYVLGRGPAQPRSSSPWHPLSIPVEIYDLSLEDVTLPATVRTPVGESLITKGAFALTPGTRPLTLRLAPGSLHHAVLLATTLQNDEGLAGGAPIATLTVAGKHARQTVALRKGREVADWQQAGSGAGSSYETGYRWTHLVDLVGQRSYPGAYRQFTAGIAVSVIPISGAQARQLMLQYRAPTGTLRIWAVATQ